MATERVCLCAVGGYRILGRHIDEGIGVRIATSDLHDFFAEIRFRFVIPQCLACRLGICRYLSGVLDRDFSNGC